MPRRPRISTGGVIYHVLNRAVGRQTLFSREEDYDAFLRVLDRTYALLPMRVLSLCLMPNHWHLVVWPREDGELSQFMRLLTVTHTQRWHAAHHTAGTGPLYQGRFKSFPIQRDDHLATVCRYVERNAVRAKLVQSARQWKWASVAMRLSAHPPAWLLPQKKWPIDLPSDWPAWVDRAETAAELEALHTSIQRGRPFGEPTWQQRTARQLGLESTLRPRGRQRIRPKGGAKAEH